MKILYVNKFFFLNGGSETVFFQEREFARQAGFAVIDFSMLHSHNVESVWSDFFCENIDYSAAHGVFEKIKAASSFIYNKNALAKLEELLVKEKPDIAHLHNIYHQITPAIIPLLAKHNVKVVMTLHDYKLVCPSYTMNVDGEICNLCAGGDYTNAIKKACGGGFLNSALLAVEAYYHRMVKSYDGVDLFISPSEFLAETVSQRIDRSRVEVIYNGVDANKYEVSKEDDGYILYFGRLSEEKGIETLLRAGEYSESSLPIKVVGTGPMYGYLVDRYKAVDFLGFKHGEELKQLISKASFIVVPSECNENCSMVVLESMAYGKAVIGSNVAGIPEQIEPGVTGFLFEMGNIRDLIEKMEQLSYDKQLRLEMGVAARCKLQEKYSLDKHVSDVFSVYEKLMAI